MYYKGSCGQRGRLEGRRWLGIWAYYNVTQRGANKKVIKVNENDVNCVQAMMDIKTMNSGKWKTEGATECLVGNSN